MWGLLTVTGQLPLFGGRSMLVLPILNEGIMMTAVVKERDHVFENKVCGAAAQGQMSALMEILKGDRPVTPDIMCHAIFFAGRHNQVSAVSALIAYAKERDIDWAFSEHGPQIVYAAGELAADVVDVFITEKADVKARVPVPRNPKAPIAKGADALEMLFAEAGVKLSGDSTPEYKDEIRRRADHIARALLTAGADPSARRGGFGSKNLIARVTFDHERCGDSPIYPAIHEWDAAHPRKYFGLFGPRLSLKAGLAPV
jgi:hypothetical protein